MNCGARVFGTVREYALATNLSYNIAPVHLYGAYDR